MLLISLISGIFFGMAEKEKETPLFPFFCPSALPGCRLVYYEIASTIKTSVLRYYCLVSDALVTLHISASSNSIIYRDGGPTESISTRSRHH